MCPDLLLDRYLMTNFMSSSSLKSSRLALSRSSSPLSSLLSRLVRELRDSVTTSGWLLVSPGEHFAASSNDNDNFCQELY